MSFRLLGLHARIFACNARLGGPRHLSSSCHKSISPHLGLITNKTRFLTHISKRTSSAGPAANGKTSHDGDKQNELISKEPGDPQEVVEEELSVSSFARTNLVPEAPITCLEIEQHIKKADKKGSFAVDMFIGKYDDDFLTYPDPLESRNQNQKLKEQITMIKQLWPRIWDDKLQLTQFNFFNLFQLSVAEMMTVFEAIGASTRASFELNPTGTTPTPMAQNFMVSKSVISLIIHNCLTYWPIYKSDSDAMKQLLLPKRNIRFEDSFERTEDQPSIGFCWTETIPNLGSLAPQEWQTQGQHGGKDVDFYSIKGKKMKIFQEGPIENYLVFYRDKFLSEQYMKNPPEEEPNPASDPFIGCCIINKSELTHGPSYQDSAGFRYTDIELDVTVPGNRSIFPAQRKDPRTLNVKALGQIATSSVIMGMLKDSLRRTYIHLIEHRQSILNCDIVQRKLANVTSKIFALESMIYYLAGMYDGLEDGFDAHLEAVILKTVANDYAYEVLRDLQQICGSEMFVLSKVLDLVNVYDSFLDGNLYNRLYLSTMGVIWYARSRNVELNELRLSPWYPGYLVKHLFRQRAEISNILTLDADIYGSLHPSLKEAAVNLEFVIKRIKFATEHICMRHGQDATSAQSQLYRLAQLSIDAFVLTACCARASKSYCNGSRNSDIDVALTTAMSERIVRLVKVYMEEIHAAPMQVIENRAPLIHELNMKSGGYYAESPLDPNC